MRKFLKKTSNGKKDITTEDLIKDLEQEDWDQDLEKPNMETLLSLET